MLNLHHGMIALLLLLCPVTPAKAQVSIGIGFPSVSIGINLPLFPELVRVPEYPVYYAPRVNANYFFYDGLYWVYQDNNWYASSWYNGPWWLVDPQIVPLFVLRIPVRYYRLPPRYFHGWQQNAPPRWGQHWGHDWERQRSGWDRWERRSAPAPAPLPDYQRRYSGNKYPRVEQQPTLRSQNYRYQPQDTIVREHFKQLEKQKAPAPVKPDKRRAPAKKNPKPQAAPYVTPVHQGGQAGQQHPTQAPPQQRGPALHDQQQPPTAVRHNQQAPKPQDQEQKPEGVESQDPRRGPSQWQGQGQGPGQGQSSGQ